MLLKNEQRYNTELNSKKITMYHKDTPQGLCENMFGYAVMSLWDVIEIMVPVSFKPSYRKTTLENAHGYWWNLLKIRKQQYFLKDAFLIEFSRKPRKYRSFVFVSIKLFFLMLSFNKTEKLKCFVDKVEYLLNGFIHIKCLFHKCVLLRHKNKLSFYSSAV